jgi:hypothetical protein
MGCSLFFQISKGRSGWAFPYFHFVGVSGEWCLQFGIESSKPKSTKTRSGEFVVVVVDYDCEPPTAGGL